MERLYCKSPSELCQIWGEWLSAMAKWEWYSTFTFRDPENKRFPGWSQIGWASAHNSLKKWHNALVEALKYSNPLWVACMELQRRGVPHWHLLVAGVEGERRMDWVDWWYEHYGIARIVAYDERLGARYYLGKYLTKAQADIEFSPGLSAKLHRA